MQLLTPHISAPRGRPQRNKNSALQDILAAERLDEWGTLDKKHRQRKPHSKRITKRVKVMDNSSDLDPDDDEYQTDTADSTSEASNASQDEISNGEVSAGFDIFTSPPFS